MADAETKPQPPPENGTDVTVDDGEEEESKVNSTLSLHRSRSVMSRYFTGDNAYEAKSGGNGKRGEEITGTASCCC